MQNHHISSNHCHCAFKSNNWRAEQPLTITVVKTVTRKNLLKKTPVGERDRKSGWESGPG